MPDLKRFHRQLGRRLTEIQRERGWEKDDFKRMGYNHGSWERHRRGDAGMQAESALTLCAMSSLTVHGLFRGTDKGIYDKLPPVVRKRPYQTRRDLNLFAENRFRTQIAACRALPEYGRVRMTLDEFKVRFGWRIRRLRLERSWSSGDIAARKGDWNTWQAWEAGKTCPKISSWVSICEILKINLDILLKDIETEGDDLLKARG